MDIDRCNSIFELFAAFNFTYAVISSSNDNRSELNGHSFAEVIDENLMKSFNLYVVGVKKDYTTTLAYIKESVETFMERQEVVANASLHEDAFFISKQASKHSATVLGWVADIEDKKKEARTFINERFPQISLLLGLFCVCVLILSTTQSAHKHLILTLVDVSIILTLWKLFVVNSNNSHVDYILLLKNFLIFNLAVFLLHIFIKFYVVDHYRLFYDKYLTYLDGNVFLRPAIIIVTLILPSFHFAFFFAKFAYTLFRIKNDSSRDEMVFKKNIDDLATETDHILKKNPPINY